MTERVKTTYSYDSMYRMASAAVTTDTGLHLSASYTYEDDLLTSIQTASTTYDFAYGNFALRTSVDIGERNLATYSYTQDGNNYLSRLDYGNGDSVQYQYDNLGRIILDTYEDGDTVSYQYDNSGALATVKDSATGRKTTYYYDLTDRMVKYVESGTGYNHSVGYEYNADNNLTSLVETINGTDYTTSYVYDDDNRVTSMTTGGTTVEYTYDAYGRISTQVTKRGDTTILTETYTYVNPTSTTTSSQIATYKTEAANYSVTYTYTYDDNGNILSVNDGINTTSYVYDSANQLIRENCQRRNITYVWTYDNAGNILDRKQYTYTTGEITSSTPKATNSYTYGDEDWGDLLTAYNGAEITYDEIGNPLSDGTSTYTWEHGRQLATQTKNGVAWTYTYDANGMRTSRTSDTKSYSYVYSGDKLVQMTITDHTTSPETVQLLEFTYDAAGQPLTLTLDGTRYYYVLNIQGDVTGLTDEAGNIQILYYYEGYGEGRYLGDTSDMTPILVAANPLAYRGYVFDFGNGQYYLQSRYYDPKVGRFLNADKYFSGVGGDILGGNMFAYCFNNPVNLDDMGGTWPTWIKNTVKALVKYTIRPVIKATQKILSKINLTYSTGISVSGTPSIIAFNGQVGVSIDTKGNVAIQKSIGSGITSSDASASIGGYQSVTNAPSIDKLNGPSYQIGASAIIPVEGVPVYAGKDYMYIPDAESKIGYWGTTKTAGLGLGEAGGEVHFEWGATDTWQASYINVFDSFDVVYDILLEW